MGFSSFPSFMNIKATDQAPLDEISQLFEQSKGIHAAIKNNLTLYKSCSPEAITGKYDRDKHNINIFIHPVIVALFLPKLKAIEDRMLISNIGRMIVQRTSHLLRQYRNYSLQVTQRELMCDLELMYEYISEQNAAAAEREVAKILEVVEMLEDNPAIGRAGRVAETRELIVGNYIVAYRAKEDAIQILRVIHAKRKWPGEM